MRSLEECRRIVHDPESARETLISVMDDLSVYELGGDTRAGELAHAAHQVIQELDARGAVEKLRGKL